MLPIHFSTIRYKSSRLAIFSFLLSLIFFIGITGCSEIGVNADNSDSLDKEMTKQGSSMLNSNAPFSVLNQGFNSNITPWVDQSVEGPGGWCGDIALADRKNSELNPSAGKGFAYVSNGQCNEFYSNQFFPSYTSGPASGPNPELLSSKFPDSGFIQELDIYLDPEYESGISTPIFDPEGSISITGDENVVFTYANSVCLDCDLASFQPAYFAISVVKEDGNLLVDSYKVQEAGWYTFRQLFASNAEGKLTVEFQLLKNGSPLHTKSIDTAFLSGLPTNSFDTDSIGNGYTWIVSIADNLKLPIDEHRMRPGK